MNERETVEIEEFEKVVVTSSSSGDCDSGNSDSGGNTDYWCDPGYYRDAEAVEAQARAEEAQVADYSCYVERHNASYLAVQAEAERLEAETVAYQDSIRNAFRSGCEGDSAAAGVVREAEREQENVRQYEQDVKEFERALEEESRLMAGEEAREEWAEEEEIRAEERAAERQAAETAAEEAPTLRKAELSPRSLDAPEKKSPPKRPASKSTAKKKS